jgi:hypothetical protein
MGLMGLIIYTVVVFPQIPREWGGGQKPFVQLFLTERLQAVAEDKDIPSTKDGKTIGPVVCVLETDHAIIIASLNQAQPHNGNYKTIAVDRKVVTAVVYESRQSQPTLSATGPNPTSTLSEAPGLKVSTSQKPNSSKSMGD